jgi:hypothetical protein
MGATLRHRNLRMASEASRISAAGPFERAASRRTLARDTFWQGDCDLSDQQLRSSIAPIRNAIPIEHPVGNSPAKTGFLQTALSKMPRTHFPALISIHASGHFR